MSVQARYDAEHADPTEHEAVMTDPTTESAEAPAASRVRSWHESGEWTTTQRKEGSMALTEAEEEVLRASEDPRKTSGERLAAVRRLTGTASVRGEPGFEELMKRSTGRNRHSKRAT